MGVAAGTGGKGALTIKNDHAQIAGARWAVQVTVVGRVQGSSAALAKGEGPLAVGQQRRESSAAGVANFGSLDF